MTKPRKFQTIHDAAFRFGRKEDFWGHEWYSESVHGSDSAWMFARRKRDVDSFGLHAKTNDPDVLSDFARDAAKSMADAADAAHIIFGWKPEPGLQQAVKEIEALIEPNPDSPGLISPL